MLLFASLQRSLSLWWTCVDVQRGWLWDESVYRRSRHCLCPSLWRITSSTSESAGPHVETHTRTQRGSLRRYYSATIRPQRENVYIVAHWWNLKFVFLFVCFSIFISLFMSCLNYWWLLEEARGTVWRRARAAAAQQTCSASRCMPRPGEYDRKHINLGMPLKAHSNNRSSFPECKACRAQSSDTGDWGGLQVGLSRLPNQNHPHGSLSGRNKPWKVSSHRTTRGRLHDWQQPFSLFCLGWMYIPEDTHARTHENDQQSYTDFTSFCSLWAWVTFLSDFIVSVRFQLMMMILSRCLAIF